MISLSTLVESAGPAFLRPIRLGPEVEVHDLALAEIGDAVLAQPGDLVLGVALGTRDETLGVLRRSAEAGAVALVLRAPLAGDQQVVAAALEQEIGLVELQEGVGWTDLLWLLRMLIDRSGAAGALQLRGNVHQELFHLADAAAAILDAPVTIEDVNSRVIAHSELQSRTDPARVATIVGRRVPKEIVDHFRAIGVFRKLSASSEPIFVPSGPEGMQPRFILPVHAGNELLGSIWAIVSRPVDDDRVRALQQTAGTLGLHLLQLRAQDDATRWVASDRLRSLLRGSQDAGYVDLPRGPWRVVAATTFPGATDAMHHLLLWESLVRRHGWRQPLLTDIEGSLFGVVSDGGDAPGTLSWWTALVADLAERSGELHAGVGGLASTRLQLRQSYSQAAELLELQHRWPAAEQPLSADEAWSALAIERLIAAHPDPARVIVGPLAALVDHDQEHDTPYVETLTAYVLHQGRLPDAARALHIHPNTLRYRLQRLAAVMPVDLNDPTVHQALTLQLTVLQVVPPG